MRTERRTAFLTGLAVAGCLALALACKDSNMVTAPAAGSPTAASLAGTWSGTFQPDSSTCARSSVTATFEQTGAQVTGSFTATSCGPSGVFRGTLEGDRVSGSIEMLGCTGGGVSGTVGASGLTLQIGDLRRPLVTGDAVVMPGGMATLSR